MTPRSRWFPVLMTICIAGCSKPHVAPDLIRSAESAHAQGLEAMESHDYATALEQFTEAIESGGLNADQAAAALLLSADCHVELGHLDDAASVLASLEDQSPEEDQFHLVRCKLFARQGDAAKAHAEFEVARRINPAVQPPTVLK